MSLWVFISLYALAFIFVLSGHDPDLKWLDSMWATLTSKSGLIAAIVPLVSLILNSLIPSGWKAILVFWRFRNPLPGCRVFSHLAKSDPRIDLAALKNSIDGNLPRSPQKQNSLWYKIYLKHADKPAVANSHRVFLLTRDLATLAFLMLGGLGTSAFVLVSNRENAWIFTATLAGIYILLSIAARNNGNRFALNAIAQECASS